MTFVLQRLLLSAFVLICLAAADTVMGQTTIGKVTPARATTTAPHPIEGTTKASGVSPARQNQTPARSSSAGTTQSAGGTSQSRKPTPAPASTTGVSPAKLDQTPSKSGGSSSATSLRPTPSRASSTASQSSATISLTKKGNLEETSTSAPLRPTPSGGSSATSFSKKDTPSPTSGGSTSFFSQPASTPTPVPTFFSPITSTPFFSMTASSQTSFMSQPRESTSFGGSSTMGPNTESMSTQGSMSSGGGMNTTQSGLQTNASASMTSGGSMTTSGGGGMNSTISGGVETTTPGGSGGGQLIHEQLRFCNMYDSVNIPDDNAEYSNQLQKELAMYCGTDVSRFINIFPMKDPVNGKLVIQFDVFPGPGKTSDDISRFLVERVKAKNMTLTDKNGVKLDVKCDEGQIYPWTDYGPCPTVKCMNGGKCNVALTGMYYCKCPPQFTGMFCNESLSSGNATTMSSGASASTMSSTQGGQQTSSGAASTAATTMMSAPQSPTVPSATTSPMGMTTGGTGGQGGGGEMIHVQILFCNDYYSMYKTLDPNQRDGYGTQLEGEISMKLGIPPGRIQGLFLVPDPKTGKIVVQFDVNSGPGKTSDEIVMMLSNQVATRKFSLTDAYNSNLYTNCYDSTVIPVYPWTDYGPCPYQRCMNGGKCNVKPAGMYYCECRPPWTGMWCDGMGKEEAKPNNLLWLLTIPAAAALLALILCCLCCWRRQCCCFMPSGGGVKVVEVIDDDIYQDLDTRSVRSVHSCRSQGPVYTVSPGSVMMNDPGSTYYGALGRPFAVAFNDNTFSAVGYATNDAGLYTCTGGRRAPSLCGDQEIQVIMNGRRGSCCGSDYGGYHSAGMGNKYAVAYNDRTFNSYSSLPRYDRVRTYN